MANVCDYCSRGVQYGHTLQHRRGVAGGRWKRKAQKVKRSWKPNLHYARILENGILVRRRLCTRCLRRAKKAMEIAKSAKETEEKKNLNNSKSGKSKAKVNLRAKE
jgi:large subunit ribosomal protein L28